MASTRECRDALVDQGAVELLILLADTPYIQTRSQCSLALGYLSEYTVVQKSTVASMLLLSLRVEDEGLGQVEPPVGHQRLDEKAIERLHKDAVKDVKRQRSSSNVRDPVLGPGGGKSLRHMIRDGLRLHATEHGVVVEDEEEEGGGVGGGNSSGAKVAVERRMSDSWSAGQGSPEKEKIRRGSSTVSETTVVQPLGKVDKTVDTSVGATVDLSEAGVEKIVISHREDHTHARPSPSSYEYELAIHDTDQEAGGIAKKNKVVLPYPELQNGRYLEPPDRAKELHDIPGMSSKLPKDLVKIDISKAGTDGGVGGVGGSSSTIGDSFVDGDRLTEINANGSN
eukprot:gene31180-40138_t